MSRAPDNRQVVLLKSLRTNNRFYALVTPESGLRNADTIEEFPDELLLGIAYPCLEDGLNDFAVIRSTFETLDVFPDDQDLRSELMEIIEDARGKLRLRLIELRDRIRRGQAHFLGTIPGEFKGHVLQLCTRGTVRRTLDNMMKVDVFESVAATAAQLEGGEPEPVYRYELGSRHPYEEMEALPPREFISAVFDDILDAVEHDANYESKYTFDRNVFQKFIAIMFVNYATTEPIFYGTHRADYGVSADKDMSNTPLYQAVGVALRELEREREADRAAPGAELLAPVRSLDELFATAHDAQRTVGLPSFAGTDQLLGQPFVLLAEGIRVLDTVSTERTREARELILRASRQLFSRLQEMGIVSSLSANPFEGFDAK